MRSSLKEVVLILHYTKDEEALTAGTFWRSIYARVFGEVILLAPTPLPDHGISAVSAPPLTHRTPPPVLNGGRPLVRPLEGSWGSCSHSKTDRTLPAICG